jgi:hypothetical protein
MTVNNEAIGIHILIPINQRTLQIKIYIFDFWKCRIDIYIIDVVVFFIVR